MKYNYEVRDMIFYLQVNRDGNPVDTQTKNDPLQTQKLPV